MNNKTKKIKKTEVILTPNVVIKNPKQIYNDTINRALLIAGNTQTKLQLHPHHLTINSP